MNLLNWAEVLLRADAPPDIVDLHVKDTLAAFRAGFEISEARDLAEVCVNALDPVGTIGTAAGIARLSECDAIHLPSCVTSCAAVIPAALSLELADDSTFRRAVAAGCAAGAMLGRAIGGTKALAHGVWPSLLAAPVMTAVTVAVARGLNPERLAYVMALALTHSDGHPTGIRQPFRRWFLFAQSVIYGTHATDIAAELDYDEKALGPFSHSWFVERAGHEDIDMSAFETAPSLAEIGLKPFPIARQAMNAVIAFQRLLAKIGDVARVDSVEVFVPPSNVGLISRPLDDTNRLSRLSNMGLQIACAALAPSRLYDPQRLLSRNIVEFVSRVSVVPDKELEPHLPDYWAARVVVKAGSQSFEEIVIRTDYDAGAPHLASRLQEKWARLVPGETIGVLTDRARVWQDMKRRVKIASERKD